MFEAIGGLRGAIMRVLRAHIALLRAELAITGRELGIIIGLAVGALVIAILVGILLYVGTFLFLGDWLFGSMGWGIIHGTLIGAVFIAFVAIDLAGGDLSRYGLGALVGIVVTIILAALLLSNLGNESGEAIRRFLVDEFETERLPFGDEWLVLLSGLVLGALIGLVVGLLIAWRAGLSGSARSSTVVGLMFVGLLAFGIYLPTRYQAPDGVLGLAITIGLIVWIATGVLLAARKGFDPEARYADLVPRESIEAAKRTRTYLEEQWRRQKRRMLGR